MPSHRTHSKRDRETPPGDDDEYRHRHRDRSRSPHKAHKSKGKEKDFLVRKRFKHGDTPPPNPSSWLLWIAGSAISREDRKKHKYSLEKRGKAKSNGKDRDREHRDRKKYPESEYKSHGHHSRDDDDGYSTPEDQTARLHAKMEELSKPPQHVLNKMEKEEKLRHQRKASIRPQMPGEAPRPDFDNLDGESIYEGYMRRMCEQEELRRSRREKLEGSKRENTYVEFIQSQGIVRVPQQRISKETELERQARRERESWDRFRKGRKEEGLEEDEREEAILINGERYVKQGSRDQYLHAGTAGTPPPSVATESTSTPWDEQSPILQQLRDMLEKTISLGKNLTTSSADLEQKKRQGEEEGVKIEAERAFTRLLGLLPALSFGNESVPVPQPASSSHSCSSRGSNREQPLPNMYPTKNTAEAIVDANACPNPFCQAYRERHIWSSERPSGVERPAVSSTSRRKASYPRRYSPAQTTVTISEPNASDNYQPKTEKEDQTHRVYRVPSYHMNSSPNPQPQQYSAAPTANTRRRRRRGLSEELSTVAENRRTPAHGHGHYP